MSDKYNYYLKEHIDNVIKGYRWIIDNIPDIASQIGTNISYPYNHDKSKYSQEEYESYDKYFYGNNRSFAVVNDFKYAWLHHIHNNPHHWQYWILHNDDDGEEVLDMPLVYIIEMIADWWSFSWAKGNLYEIFNWYDDHKTKVKLSDKTRKKVEDILSRIKIKLDEENIK